MTPFRPHTCRKCRRIVIDGTGPEVDLSLEFSYRKVKKLSKDCKFFRWTLRSSAKRLRASYKLSLSISTDSEDLVYLNVGWMDEYDKHVSPDDGKRQLHIFSTEHGDAAEYIKSRPLTRSRASSVTLEKCLEHYKSCLNHEMCKEALRSNKRNTAPKSLLEIRQNSELYLYTVPQGENPLYAALTYCWGNSQQQQNAKTTSENVKNRHGGIDKRQLPQTIIDAVKIARTLELSYLWVDALCIAQDNVLEQESEMSKMESIYSAATITISAASANDSAEGFLGDRDLKKAYGNLFKLPYYNKRAGHVVKGWLLLSEHPIADTYEENIDKRAWTMQEDMLSVRLLRFGSKQTTWRCLHLSESLDGGGYPMLKNKDPDFSVDDPHRKIEVQSNVSYSGSLGGSCVKINWLDAVTEYTRRKLTIPSDRLPACAALAKNFGDIMGFDSSHYLAGLWKDDICAQLLWRRLEARQAESTCGPSWSWSSINGPVEFFERYLLEDCNFEVDAAAKYVGSYRDSMPNDHKYSDVGSGRLQLNGRLKEAHWDSLSLRRSISNVDVLPLRIYWDVSGGVSSRTVWCFEIIGSYISLGLVLRREKQKGYKRVGYFECSMEESTLAMKSFFDETEPQTIEIY